MATKKVASACSAASLRWEILRRAFLSRRSRSDVSSEMEVNYISRRTTRGFNMIPWTLVELSTTNGSEAQDTECKREAYVSYKLPTSDKHVLVIIQRSQNDKDLSDFEICQRRDIDNTGLICQWPSEHVLAYFCLTHADMFRSKRVLELGAGYGLAGLAIAAGTDASEVVLSDGNPEVIDYIWRSIRANERSLGDTKVKVMLLHWNHTQTQNASAFDVIVASDCTFFKECHDGLTCTVKSLLKCSGNSEAIFFSPKRGDSLDLFVEQLEAAMLHVEIIEKYDDEVWELHTGFMDGSDTSWPNYDMDHCYPLLIRITL